MAYRTIIGVADLARVIASGEVAVFDCGFDLADPAAGEAAWRAGHLPGAHYLHLDRDLAAPATGHNGRHPLPDPARFAANLRRAGLKQGQQAIAYDASGGVFAARLWWMLRWIGHDAVAVLDGGRQAWIAAGHPLVTDAPIPEPGDVTARPDDARVVDADAVARTIGSGGPLVLDARSAERFAGAPHPLDPRPGHIPGARSHFYGRNLDADGRFRDAATLAEEYRRSIGDRTPADVILQCGSGVTACHNALAMAIADLPGARLYPGSWSEWAADPKRPVEQDARP